MLQNYCPMTYLVLFLPLLAGFLPNMAVMVVFPSLVLAGDCAHTLDNFADES